MNPEPLRILHGDVLEQLGTLPANSVHCAVTSPPYWGLRDYKIPPSIWPNLRSQRSVARSRKCQHVWQPHVKSAANGIQHEEGMSGESLNSTSATRKPQLSDYCRKCYAWRGCHGLEPTMELYVAHAVLIFREVRRVLRKDGTLWLNLGDSYANDCFGTSCNGAPAKQDSNRGTQHALTESERYRGLPDGLKKKDLCGIPWRVALALQADGWYLRSDIIWHKPNPMPEPTTDRPTKSHEYIFLLSKSEHYFYDGEAIKEPASTDSHARIARADVSHKSAPTSERNGIRSAAASQFPSMALRDDDHGRRRKPRKVSASSHFNVTHVPNARNPQQRQPGVGPKAASAGEHDERTCKANASFSAAVVGLTDTRNKRSVWTVPTAPYKGAHFATFPPDLIKPCILAGTSARGCCRKCGAPWERIVEKVDTGKTQKMPDGFATHEGGHGSFHREGREKGATSVPVTIPVTTGWQPTCKCCCPLELHPCTVLDPFAGSGTTGEVALELHRHALLIEIGEHHLPLIQQRCAHGVGLPLH